MSSWASYHNKEGKYSTDCADEILADANLITWNLQDWRSLLITFVHTGGF
jgi:hypothetical protein